MKSNLLNFLPGGALRLQGPLGQLHSKSIENRLKKLNWKLLVSIFRERSENDGGWRGEFWGKIIRGAIYSCYITQDQELFRQIKDSVYDLISTQTPDGCISSVDSQLRALDCQDDWQAPGKWDLWARKYVLIALCRYYSLLDQDPKVLAAVNGLMNHLMSEVAPGIREFKNVGLCSGLPSSSILNAIVSVWRITGDKKHLDYAKWIADSGCACDANIFQAALEGVNPLSISCGKSYELTSCFQGLSELITECDDYPDAMKALTNYYQAVRDREIYVTGIGGGKDKRGEYWNDGAVKQTSTDIEVTGGQGETCVITTWLHFLERMSRLTADASIMDEAELAIYNGLLGTITPDATNCCHENPTPLAGLCSKIMTDDQMQRCFQKPFDGHDCCRSQYHEGMALSILLAVMSEGKTPVFNLYEDMTVDFEGVKYTVTGGWPANGKVRITLSLPEPKTFAVKLRVPARESGSAFAKVGGATYDAQPGSYLTLERTWQEGDVIELTFDNSVKRLSVPYADDYVYYKRGAIVLAADSRPGFQGALANAEIDGRQLCDYVSAGNAFSTDNKIQVIFKK